MLEILNLSVSLRCRIWSWSNLRDLALGFRLLTLIVKGAIIILCWRIAISPEPNLRWTLEPVCKFKFVHCGPVDEKSSLSIPIYLSIPVYSWPSNKIQDNYFPKSQNEILNNFRQKVWLFKKFSGEEVKCYTVHLLDSSHLAQP